MENKTNTGYKILKCPTDLWETLKTSYPFLFESKTVELEGNALPSVYLLNKFRKIVNSNMDFITQNKESKHVTSYVRNQTVPVSKNDDPSLPDVRVEMIMGKNLDCGCRKKGGNVDWTLFLEDKNKVWNQLKLQEGDVIIYEARNCRHGRTDRFQGLFYNILTLDFTIAENELPTMPNLNNTPMGGGNIPIGRSDMPNLNNIPQEIPSVAKTIPLEIIREDNGLGDSILIIEWWKKAAKAKLYVSKSNYRPTLFKMMGVDLEVAPENPPSPLGNAGHNWPVTVTPIERVEEPPLIAGKYFTYQFNSISDFPGAPHLKMFHQNHVNIIKQKYKSYGIGCINIEDPSIPLEKIRNWMQNSIGHFGADSGMAWFAILCGVKRVGVWYNGYADATVWDTNWLLNFVYNGANVKMLK